MYYVLYDNHVFINFVCICGEWQERPESSLDNLVLLFYCVGPKNWTGIRLGSKFFGYFAVDGGWLTDWDGLSLYNNSLAYLKFTVYTIQAQDFVLNMWHPVKL